MATPLQSLLKEQAASRTARTKALDAKVEQVLVAVDSIENDIRASVGLQLNSVIANQQHLEASVKSLRAQINALSKKCGAWSSQHDALKQSVADIGSLELYLSACNAHLARINDNLEHTAERLASEE